MVPLCHQVVNTTKTFQSLKTHDRAEAARLLLALNEAGKQPALNLLKDLPSKGPDHKFKSIQIRDRIAHFGDVPGSWT
jgi:hypothetical protein